MKPEKATRSLLQLQNYSSKLFNEPLVIHHKYIGVQESVYLQFPTALTLLTIVHCHQLHGIFMGKGIGV